MKMNIRRLSAMVILLSAIAVHVSAQSHEAQDGKLSRKERKEIERAKVEKMLADTVYVVDVTTALPMGWKSISLSARYSVKIEKDKVVSYLPYYGRAYSLPYGGGDGLSFEGKSEDYTMEPEKKGVRKVGFSVQTREDRFDFHLDISLDGSAFITVLSNNRQPISFSGHLRIRDE